MAKLVLYLLLLISFHYKAAIADTSNTPAATNFIKSSCKVTRYPTLCIQCLSSYGTKIQQSQKQLVQAALTVSLSRAQSAAAFVSRTSSETSGTKTQAVKDCVYNVGDSVFQLKRSIQELGQMGDDQAANQDFVWHMSNVQTWVSAALTDCNTCTDGFAAGSSAAVDGNVKAAIKSRVVDVAQVTSNALALISRYAARHRVHRAAAGATTNSP